MVWVRNIWGLVIKDFHFFFSIIIDIASEGSPAQRKLQ